MSSRETGSANARAAEDRAAGARRTAIGAVVLAAAMGSLSFAAVPLYDLFCRVTGFGGTPQRVEDSSGRVVDKTITVFFDASTHRDMPWEFEPVETSMTVKLGETHIAYYRAKNPTSAPITGTATFNVAPLDIGAYFSKIQCFCFTEQTLQPGQEMLMPVAFYVEPDLADDAEHQDLSTLTLSYTFFRSEETVALAGGASAR